MTDIPGLYVLGLKFLHRRNSSFIDGVGRDARFVAAHLTRRMASRAIATPLSRLVRPDRLTCLRTQWSSK